MTICKIHNVKFYNLDANGIICMAYENAQEKLALSRTDSSIEIWNLSYMPYIERTIPSRYNSSIEALSWCNKRLFSIGLLGLLVEYDLYTLSPKYEIPFTGGIGCCMDIHENSSSLAIGTEQGYLNLYRITDTGVDYIKILDKQEGKIFCLKFDSTGHFIASGSVGAVRVWNVSSGHAIHRMTLSRTGNALETVVYCLTVADDFTIVSGDSRGYITFWDGEMGSQIESYQSHCASVLSVCLSENQNTVYCSGTDPLIMSYEKIKVKANTFKWVKSTQRKVQEYEVRSLFIVDNKLYSGGVDGYLACSYLPKTLFKYPPVLQSPCVCVAREARLILLRYQKTIEVWTFGKEVVDDYQAKFSKLNEEPKKLLELQTKRDDSTLCAAISNDGQWIVYSTVTQLRVFYFTYEENKPQLTPMNELPNECSPCVRAEFTPDSKQLILAPLVGGLMVLNMVEGQLYLSQTIDTSNFIKDTITFLQISPDGSYIVAADPNSNIAAWTATSNKWKYHCTLPKYHYSPTALGTHPISDTLIVVYCDNKIIEYNLKERTLTKFSHTLNMNSARQWLGKSYPVINVTFDPSSKDIILLHDEANIYVINKKKNMPVVGSKIPRLDSSSKLERQIDHAIYVLKKYKHLVYFGYSDNNEMVSVEVTPMFFQRNLRPSIPKKKFGRK